MHVLLINLEELSEIDQILVSVLEIAAVAYECMGYI